MRRLLILPLLALAAPLSAQEAEQTASTRPPQRIKNVMLREGEECPKANGDEIVVCGRLDPDELYRIPEPFRQPRFDPANNSWTNRAQTIMEVNRAGLPNSCSPIGTGGQTGCNQQLLDQWWSWKREQQSEAARIP